MPKQQVIREISTRSSSRRAPSSSIKSNLKNYHGVPQQRVLQYTWCVAGASQVHRVVRRKSHLSHAGGFRQNHYIYIYIYSSSGRLQSAVVSSYTAYARARVKSMFCGVVRLRCWRVGIVVVSSSVQERPDVPHLVHFPSLSIHQLLFPHPLIVAIIPVRVHGLNSSYY